MKFKLSPEGHLIGEDDQPVKIVGHEGPVIVEGLMDSNAVEGVVKERLTRAEKKAKEIQEAKDREREELIEGYKKKLEKATSAEDVAKINERIKTLQGEVEDKERQAADRANQLKKQHAQELESVRSQADGWKKNYESLALETEILKHANDPRGGYSFINPSELVMELKARTVWEDETNEKGEKTGKRRFKFMVPVKDDGKDTYTDKEVDAPAAALAIAQLKPHWVKSGVKPGFGMNGSSLNGGGPIVDVSKMSPQEKLAAAYNK